MYSSIGCDRAVYDVPPAADLPTLSAACPVVAKRAMPIIIAAATDTSLRKLAAIVVDMNCTLRLQLVRRAEELSSAAGDSVCWMNVV